MIFSLITKNEELLVPETFSSEVVESAKNGIYSQELENAVYNLKDVKLTNKDK